MQKKKTRVSLTVFFIYSAPGKETLCSTSIWLGPAGPSLLAPLLISPVWIAGTVRPHVEEARNLSPLWSLHLRHLPAQFTAPRFNTFCFVSTFPRCTELNNYNILHVIFHWPRYFRYSSGWESKWSRYLEIVSVRMDANVLKTADHCWPLTLQDLLAIWSLERGWRSLEVRSFRRTALEAPSQLAPKWALYERLPPKMFSYFAKDWLIFDWFDRA